MGVAPWVPHDVLMSQGRTRSVHGRWVYFFLCQSTRSNHSTKSKTKPNPKRNEHCDSCAWVCHDRLGPRDRQKVSTPRWRKAKFCSGGSLWKIRICFPNFDFGQKLSPFRWPLTEGAISRWPLFLTDGPLVHGRAHNKQKCMCIPQPTIFDFLIKGVVRKNVTYTILVFHWAEKCNLHDTGVSLGNSLD